LSGASRDEILSRIAAALRAAGEPDSDPPPPRHYRVAAEGLGETARIERFAERLADYRAVVRRVADGPGVAAAVAAAVAAGPGSWGVPAALPAAWLRAVDPGRLVLDDGTLTPRILDALAGSVSGCALAVAETGTIILDGAEAQGRRALTLVPDRLVVVVRTEQIVATVPEAIRALGPAMRQGPRALTLISGPSATSDIELSRVEGVHGPRHLCVVIAPGA
jgi:L-lactate dehydrogenase complex protein LldG